jgi:hypothetical protein
VSKYCSDCVNLDTNNAKCDGVYKCKLINDFTNTSNCSCEKFEKSYGRNSLEKQKLYDLGKKSNSKGEDISIEIYIFILILLIILAIIAKINSY